MNEKLIKTAIDMRNKSHSPYSNYRVGAAVETESGKIIGGCNVESSSYGLTCCAERVALYSAISEGHDNFKSMAISTENGGMPCGACRQVIWDLCNDIKIYICNGKELLRTINSSDLLPDAFDESFLK
jgi:cytidine deaminase|tara:strand:+ start:113 stop:496 length:384 start_codon:yes stop_codon:yes gene_type:complete